MITLEHINKTYRNAFGKVTALQDISMNFPDTGSIAVTGKSGCGKTTLLNILGGLDTPDTGDYKSGNLSMISMTEQEWDT